MRILTFIGILSLCGWLTTAASAQVSDAPKNTVVLGATAQETVPIPADTAESKGNSWRYVYHNHQWWYYLPSKQWMVWNDGHWIASAELARPAVVEPQPFRTGHRGTQMYYRYQPQPVPDPYLGRPIYRRFFPNMPFVPFSEDPTTSQPVTGAGQR